MNGAFREGSKSPRYSLLKIERQTGDKNMIRTTLIALAIAATAATAIASANLTASSKIEIGMNDIGRVAGPLVVEKCAVEDCSDTPTS
jgi:hypothetical protein